jgi:hypothetical protein
VPVKKGLEGNVSQNFSEAIDNIVSVLEQFAAETAMLLRR